MAEKIKAPRGTQDILPEQTYKWQYVEGVLRSVARDFGGKEIRFPVFEHTELFLRGVGDTTDVVSKEMYTFADKSNRSLTLRPEGTASVVRALVEHSLAGEGLPLKTYYIAPNFRYENPQAGRYRQHHQFGVEFFGSSLPSAEAEVIGLAHTFLGRLGIHEVELHLNSLGCPDCRPQYNEALKAFLQDKKGELCGTCLDRLERNPLRVLDCKSPVCRSIAAQAPVMLDSLCPPCESHHKTLTDILTTLGIPFEIDAHIVRGLDYYTRTVFEFVSQHAGAQGTVLGGGRYDKLVETLGGQATPALGFGCGLERLLLVMDGVGARFPAVDRPDLYLCQAGLESDLALQRLCYQLRQMGVWAEKDILGRSLKAQMKHANKLNVRFAVVIGEDEIKSNTAKLKNMANGETVDCPLIAEKIAEAIV